VSRLIGNLDTTAKLPGWQADFAPAASPRRTFLECSPPLDLGPILAQTHETPLESSGVSRVLRWSLASQVIGRWCSTVPLTDSPGRSSLLRAASLAVALTGRLL